MMPERMRVPKGRVALDRAERQELFRRVVGLNPSGSVLPPPVTIEVRLARHTSASQFDVAVATDDSRDRVIGELCEVTGCLDPHLCVDAALDVLRFRDWAISTPEHPLAVRYQPLSAWLRAARCDSRFLVLAEEFVRGERARLQAELVGAAERLLRCGCGSVAAGAFRRRA